MSGPDPKLVSRCHVYSAALHLRYDVAVRSILILLRPKADAENLTGKLAYSSGQSGVEFRCEVVRMWKQPVALFLRGGVNLLPLATLCEMPPDQPMEEALHKVVQEIDRRLLAECDHAQAVRLMTAAFILTGSRVKEEMLGPIYEGVRVMHEESTAWDYYEEKGRIQGEIQGIAQGLAQGEIQGKRELLLRLGQKLLGSPDETTVTELKAIKDSDRLDRLADAVFTSASWQELLATP